MYTQPTGLDDLAAKYPQYPRATFIRWANKLGIIRKEPTEWTPEQDQVLRDNADKSMKYLLGLFPGYTKDIIKARRTKLGLVEERIKYWTEERLKILEENISLPAKELQERYFPEISPSSINYIRRKKFNSHGSRGFWTKEHQEQFIEAYQKGGAREVLKNPEFRGLKATALNEAAKRYGVSYRESFASWSEEEIAVIEGYLDTPESEREPLKEFAKRFSGRSYTAVQQRKAKIEKKRKEAEANETDTDTKAKAKPGRGEN